MVEYSSDLVLKTENRNRDAFLFRVQGIFKTERNDKEKDEGGNKQRKVNVFIVNKEEIIEPESNECKYV